MFIALSAFFVAGAQDKDSDYSYTSTEPSMSSDTSVTKRIQELEQRLTRQEKKMATLQKENEQLKQQVAASAKREPKKKKKYVVNRVGSKQLVLDTSDDKKPTHDSVNWDNLRR